jgi:hypothetical protein
MPQLIGQLQQNGISVRIRDRQPGEITGISYELNGIAFSGTHLGKAYTFAGLQKYRGVDYESHRDNQLIKKLVEKSICSSTKTKSNKKLIVHLSNLEERQGSSKIENKNTYNLLKHRQQQLEV